jgi:hypothetical protein
MKNRLLPRTAFVLCVGALFTPACFAQKVPVSILAPTEVKDDDIALKFTRSLSDEIQLSGKFYSWSGPDADLPQNGVRIFMMSVKVGDSGSAIFAEATGPGAKDPGCYKRIAAEMWFIPRDVSVADDTRGFLAYVDRKLGH